MRACVHAPAVDGRGLLPPLLLTQELEHGREIFAGVPARTHHAVDLMGQRAQRDGGLGAGGRVLSQTQILEEHWRT